MLWTEWNGKLPRRDAARSGGATTVASRRWRHASRAATTCTSTAAAVRTRASTSSRRTTASRCRTSSATTTKHNEANGDNNQDGESSNLSWNCGVEGPARDPRVVKLREQQKRNLMASLLLSVGVPMISGGDEMGRTQHGQQQRLLPRQRAQLDALGHDPEQRRLPGVHTAPRALPALAADAVAAQVFPGTFDPRRRRQGHLLARPERPRNDRLRVERAVRCARSAC